MNVCLQNCRWLPWWRLCQLSDQMAYMHSNMPDVLWYCTYGWEREHEELEWNRERDSVTHGERWFYSSYLCLQNCRWLPSLWWRSCHIFASSDGPVRLMMMPYVCVHVNVNLFWASQTNLSQSVALTPSSSQANKWQEPRATEVQMWCCIILSFA